jgi:hypothetical protein
MLGVSGFESRFGYLLTSEAFHDHALIILLMNLAREHPTKSYNCSSYIVEYSPTLLTPLLWCGLFSYALLATDIICCKPWGGGGYVENPGNLYSQSGLGWGSSKGDFRVVAESDLHVLLMCKVSGSLLAGGGGGVRCIPPALTPSA